MDQPEQRFQVDTRVKLREGVDPGLYNGFSRVGNEGWIRKRKRDKYGYPQVLIEWDKDHWAYNGQEDGWTWEGQFEATKENGMDKGTQPDNSGNLEDQVRAIAEDFVKSIFSVLSAPVAQSDIDEDPENDEDDWVEDPDRWEELAVQAKASIGNSPAYLVMALEYAQGDDSQPTIMPSIFCAARDPKHALMIQSHLAHVLANLQDATIENLLALRANAAGESK